MLLLLLLLLASFSTLTQCRVRHLTSSTPTLSSPPDTTLLTPPTLSSPPDTLSIPPPQPLLPPVDPDMPVTSTCPPPPPIPYCCVLAAPPPPGSSPSLLYSLFVSTFGRVCTGVIISGAIYVVYLAFCRRRRDPVRHGCRGPIRDPPTSHPHSVSGSEAETPGQSPLPTPPHYPFDIGTDPGWGDFIPGVGF